MFAWIERQRGMFFLHWMSRTIGWFYPELKRVENPGERIATAMALDILRPLPIPKWLRFFLIVLGIPLAFTVGLLRLGQGYFKEDLLIGISFAVGFPAGVAVSYFLWLLFGVWWYAPIIEQTLANLGHNTCPNCGYDMRGHDDRPESDRICPECGIRVPFVQSLLDAESNEI